MTAKIAGSVAVVMSAGEPPATTAVRTPVVRTDLMQNTPEWEAWRRVHLNGSDAPVVMMEVGDPYRLWQVKTGAASTSILRDWYEDGQRIEHPAKRGHRLEPDARARYCIERGIFAPAACLEHRETTFMGCSLDGYLAGDRIIEIKCPKFIRTHLDAREGTLPPAHLTQCQHNMFVAGVTQCDYVSYWVPDYGDAEMVVVPVEFDAVYVERLMAAEREFWQQVIDGVFTMPAGEREIDSARDAEWADMVARYTVAVRMREEAERLEDAALRALKRRTQGTSRTRDDSIECKWIVRRGNVQWRDLPEVKALAGSYLDGYRGSDSLSFRVERLK